MKKQNRNRFKNTEKKLAGAAGEERNWRNR